MTLGTLGKDIVQAILGSFSLCIRAQGHQGPVNTLAAQQLSDGSIVLASTAAEENVRIWECPAVGNSAAHQPHTDCSASGPVPETQEGPAAGRWGTWNLLQTIPWGVQLQHCAALTQLPGKPGWWASHWLA